MRSCKVSISGQVYHICRRNGIGESGRPFPTVSKHPCPLCLTVRSAKQRRRVPAAGLALSVIASRCHLSQSERPWQSAKFPGLESLRPAAARGAVRRCAETFRLCQGLPLWGSWREAPERARMLPGPLDPSLAGAYDGAEDKPNGGTHITSPRSTSPVPANRSPYTSPFSGRSASRWRWRRG